MKPTAAVVLSRSPASLLSSKSDRPCNDTSSSLCFQPFFGRTSKLEATQNCFKHRREIKIPKYLSCYNITASGLSRSYAIGFVVWILIIGPLVADVAREVFLVKTRLSIGGVHLANACRPGHVHTGGNRQPTINLVPLQIGEFIPKISEQTIGASGPAEGAIHRGSQRFHDELAPNWNPDIVFRDEEQTNEDRMMTKRCTDRINILAVKVANQWPGVKLRVTEGWDDPDTERIHPENSLHYEGRAVDITTTDLDRNKYSILARLAVQAGFDWVHYDKSYVHCSVKSDSSDAALYGGCFPGNARVQLPGGRSRKMAQLRPGDEVLSIEANGEIITDTILTFMDLQLDYNSHQNTERMFISITTDAGYTLQLTPNHLIYVSNVSSDQSYSYLQRFLFNPNFEVPSEDATILPTAIFAGKVEVGQYAYVMTESLFADTLRPSRIVKVELVSSTSGAYAPLTSRGTILVEGTLASCYAVIENDFIAHLTMTPVRYFHYAQHWIRNLLKFPETTLHDETRPDNHTLIVQVDQGVTLYAKILYHLGSQVVPSTIFWGD